MKRKELYGSSDVFRLKKPKIYDSGQTAQKKLSTSQFIYITEITERNCQH
jgi:hypothetical protein